MYMKTGEYKIIPKKEKKKGGNGLTKEKIKGYLQDNDKEGLKEYEMLMLLFCMLPFFTRPFFDFLIIL
mgnify:CR=1 FL=1